MIASVYVRKNGLQPATVINLKQGTPNIADTIGLGAAFEYLNSLGLEQIEQHES